MACAADSAPARHERSKESQDIDELAMAVSWDEDGEVLPSSSAYAPRALAFQPFEMTVPSMGAKGRCASLVNRLTVQIKETYQLCNSTFTYSESFNPKRILTRPSAGVSNDGFDNVNSDLILGVNNVLLNAEAGRRYVIKDMLGQGTFGQVAKCWKEDSNEYVAVKVIKNQPAYYHQAFVEISVLKMLNQHYDADDQHHIVRLLDHFVHQRHLCLVFELLTYNLFELIKQNQFRGLSMNLVRLFVKQILEALSVLKKANVIHCDLKPENILLQSLQSGEIKLIDFGSACMENRTVYSYIQSRFYRSPEVVLQHPYTTAIDMWSLGCVAAELFLGLPLFPGASDYNLLSRMIETLGTQPPDQLLHAAKNSGKFFKRRRLTLGAEGSAGGGSWTFSFLSEDEFEAQEGSRAPVGKRYFKHQRLADIIVHYSLKRGTTPAELEAEHHTRLAFVHFLQGLLHFDPLQRWTPRQAVQHPFLTQLPFHGAWQPPPDLPRAPLSTTICVPHNPQQGHWSAGGLSPHPTHLRHPPPLSPQRAQHPAAFATFSANSLGSYGSYGSSYGEGMALGSSYGSYGDSGATYLNFPTPPNAAALSAMGGAGPGLSPESTPGRRFLHLPKRPENLQAESSPARHPATHPTAMSLGVSPSQGPLPAQAPFSMSPGGMVTQQNSPRSGGPYPGGPAQLGPRSLRIHANSKRRTRDLMPPPLPLADAPLDLATGWQAWQRSNGPPSPSTAQLGPRWEAAGAHQGAAYPALSPNTGGAGAKTRWGGYGQEGQSTPQKRGGLSHWSSGGSAGMADGPSEDGGEDMSPPPDPGDWNPDYSDDLLLAEESAGQARDARWQDSSSSSRGQEPLQEPPSPAQAWEGSLPKHLPLEIAGTAQQGDNQNQAAGAAWPGVWGPPGSDGRTGAEGPWGAVGGGSLLGRRASGGRRSLQWPQSGSWGGEAFPQGEGPGRLNGPPLSPGRRHWGTPAGATRSEGQLVGSGPRGIPLVLPRGRGGTRPLNQSRSAEGAASGSLVGAPGAAPNGTLSGWGVQPVATERSQQAEGSSGTASGSKDPKAAMWRPAGLDLNSDPGGALGGVAGGLLNGRRGGVEVGQSRVEETSFKFLPPPSARVALGDSQLAQGPAQALPAGGPPGSGSRAEAPWSPHNQVPRWDAQGA